MRGWYKHRYCGDFIEQYVPNVRAWYFDEEHADIQSGSMSFIGAI